MAPVAAGERTIDGEAYIHTLASYVRRHEDKLADFVRRKPPPTAPSWTTILTMGVVSSDVPVAPKQPLVLRFDPHHLYYLLLKFDEAGVGGGAAGIGSLDVLVDGGPSRPMSINYGHLPVQPSTGFLGLGSDTASLNSTFSAVSSFSLGSGWWGASKPQVPDVTANVRSLYSSCTKLPALRLSPFTFSSMPASASSSTTMESLNKPVRDFEDCPPPDTAVPLYAFKNLQSLVLEDLDPRGFLGWDVLSVQLRSLALHRSGIEDVGELLCDAVVEDIERRKKGRGGVGEERRRRQGLSLSEAPPSSNATSEQQSTTDPTRPVSPSLYPVPPPYAWSQLRHLSLSSNSLTFIPAGPLANLSSLTSLDLSSNLLISVPPSLAALTSLTSLNLSDNMIDTLFGIPKAVGNVHVINLSHNRIENLSGLDRLYALERVDLRHNRVAESLEVSRVARLPCLREVWIEGNPFARPREEGGEDAWRAKCFGYFASEGREDVLLDGRGPGMTERRFMDAGSSGAKRRDTVGRGRGVSTAARRVEDAAGGVAPKLVVDRRVTGLPQARRAPSTDDFVRSDNATEMLTKSPPTSPSKNGGVKPHRRRRPQRIVDLDGDHTAPSSVTSGLAGEQSDSSGPNSSPQLQPATSYPEGDRQPLERTSSRHSRYPTTPTDRKVTPTTSTSLGHSKQKPGALRRDRVSASTFDAPVQSSSSASDPERDDGGRAFRKRIEDLRAEVGESWLAVLSEREAAAEQRAKSKSDGDSSTDGVKKVAPARLTSHVAPEQPVVSEPAAIDADAAPPVVKVVKGSKKKRGAHAK